jgi:hypothetical protein
MWADQNFCPLTTARSNKASITKANIKIRARRDFKCSHGMKYSARGEPRDRGIEFYLLFQFAKNIQVLPDCYSFMTGISSYNGQLTHVYLLRKEKTRKIVLSFVFNMVFPTFLLLPNF